MAAGGRSVSQADASGVTGTHHRRSHTRRSGRRQHIAAAPAPLTSRQNPDTNNTRGTGTVDITVTRAARAAWAAWAAAALPRRAAPRSPAGSRGLRPRRGDAQRREVAQQTEDTGSHGKTDITAPSSANGSVHRPVGHRHSCPCPTPRPAPPPSSPSPPSTTRPHPQRNRPHRPPHHRGPARLPHSDALASAVLTAAAPKRRPSTTAASHTPSHPRPPLTGTPRPLPATPRRPPPPRRSTRARPDRPRHRHSPALAGRPDHAAHH